MLKRLVLTCMLTLAMATSAFAGDTGVYAGVKIMDSYQNQWFSGNGYSFDYSNTVGIGAFVGYDFYYNSDVAFRAELEYAIRSDWKGSETAYIAYGRNDHYASVDINVGVQTILANLYYDFHNDSMFTPYVGAGLGLGIVDVEVDYADSVGTAITRDSLNTVFAWHVGAGVSAALTESLSLDLGYRYLNLGMSETEVYGKSLENFGSAHEFSLGMRVNF